MGFIDICPQLNIFPVGHDNVARRKLGLELREVGMGDSSPNRWEGI